MKREGKSGKGEPQFLKVAVTNGQLLISAVLPLVPTVGILAALTGYPFFQVLLQVLHR